MTKEKIKQCRTLDSTENVDALKGNHEEIKYFLINYSPLIFINGYYYKGNFDDMNHLFETICSSFEKPPNPCHELEIFTNTAEMNSSTLARFILFSFLGCIVIVFTALSLFYIIYKKKIKRRFNFVLNDKINEALAQYYSENEEENKES